MVYILRYRIDVPSVQKATAVRDGYATVLEEDEDVKVINVDMARDDPDDE